MRSSEYSIRLLATVTLMTEPIKVKKRDSLLEVTIDRPKANAIDAATSRELGRIFDDFEDDASSLVAIITGAGDRIFSAGWDLKAATAGESEATDYGSGGFGGLTENFRLTKPVIAAINGVAVGGGVEIALACDLIVAAEHATFSLPETSVGVTADAGGLQRLPRKMPINIANEMLLTGRKLDVTDAKRFGLVNYVESPANVMPKARELAHEIAAGAPLSVRTIKEVTRGIEGLSVEQAFDAIKRRQFPTYAAMLSSEDHEEGPRAFVEKREPRWKGR